MIQFLLHNAIEPFPLQERSIQTCVTSPPYWEQRSYTGADGQIGNEETIEEYIGHLVTVSRNVWSVLKNDGSFFLNIGDKYVEKKLQLVPYRVALALMDDGWILRNTIAWNKLTPMPFPGKDRLRNSYEPVFHFVKQEKYYYNLDAIRIPHQTLSISKLKDQEMAKKKLGVEIKVEKTTGLFGDITEVENSRYKDSKLKNQERKNVGARGGYAVNGETVSNRYADGGRNPGDVFIDDPSDSWFLSSDQWHGAHTATFPRKLVEKCILVSSQSGDTVLDPFIGSGTTCVVAESLNRNSVGFDIAYSEDRDKRIGKGIQKTLLEI